MKSLLSSLKSFDPEVDYILVTIINTQGSTYRKTGAMMLVSDELAYWGLLSGGCLEGDIVERCKECFANKNDQVINYNMREHTDRLWGMVLGCDGELDLLLKYLPKKSGHLGFFEVLNSISQGNRLQLDINKEKGYRFEYSTPKNGNTNQQGKNKTIAIILEPPISLLICGGSPDVPPVTELANVLGWQTTVIDHRKDFADKSKFPKADRVRLIKRSQWPDFDVNPFHAAIIMSHQYERDKDYLSRLLPSSVEYIGLLGPRKRRDQLLEECGTDFIQHEHRLFGPIGLDIGANSPELIGLAILAEIQAVRAKKSAAFCYQDESR